MVSEQPSSQPPDDEGQGPAGGRKKARDSQNPPAAKSRAGSYAEPPSKRRKPSSNRPKAVPSSSARESDTGAGVASQVTSTSRRAGPAEKESKGSRSARPIPVADSRREMAPDDDDLEAEVEQQILGFLRRGAPSWLVSMIIHMLLIIVLALLTLRPNLRDELDLDAVFAEELGEQLDDLTIDLDSMVDLEAEITEFSESDIPVEDPFSSPPDLVTTFEGSVPTSDVAALVVGNALDGRDEGMKQILLAEYGGTETTEDAVRLGLLWLKRNQQRDGLWSLTGPYSSGTSLENKTAATAMALLAFQGAGHTHLEGEFREVVARGWVALLKRQGADGDFYQADGSQGIIPAHHLYSHAQATIAVCELYTMTKDEAFREPAEAALRFAEECQSPNGGWRYTPRSDADLSVTGWYIMAFQSAMMAGLHVNPDVLEHAKQFLRTCDADDGIRFIYKRGHEPTPDMTAEAMLCWEYLGWSRDNERLNLAARVLLLNPVDWEEKNFYYWYYATQALHHLEGDAWKEWNETMRQVIPENQVKSGREEGSWDPAGDPESAGGGRLYATCMCVFNLEVYYRHLPIYRFELR